MKKMMSLLAAAVTAFYAEARVFTWTQTEEIPCRIVASDRDGWQEVREAQEEDAARILEWPSEPAGVPTVPFRVVTFAVPDACLAEGATVTCDIDWRTLGENVRLLPIQEPVTTDQIDNAPFTEPDAAVYSRAVWPEANAVAAPTYTASGVEVLPVRVNVLRYHPTTGVLEVAKKVTLSVDFAELPLVSARAAALSPSANEEVTRPGRVSERLMNEVLSNTANGAELRLVDTNTTAIARTGLKFLSASPTASLSFAAASPKIDMVIISPPDFMELWPMYVAYRKKTHPHMNIVIKNAVEIYNEFTGVDHAQKIHKYIEKLYKENSLEYVLLGAAAPGNSGRTLSTVSPLQTAYQIPTRYAATANNHASDLYFACMDKIGNAGEVWDRQNDGLFMRTKSGADTTGNCDLYPDLVVFRMPLRPSVTDGNGPRTVKALQQMIGFTNKLARAESLSFGGAHKFFWSGGPLFNEYAKGNGSARVVSEYQFFDGGVNFFDNSVTYPAQDCINIPRYINLTLHSKMRGIADVKGVTSTFKTFSESAYYTGNSDITSDYAHGQHRGTANWQAFNSFDQGSIHKIHVSTMPCLSGFFDFGGKTTAQGTYYMCVSEASVINDKGGALASIANSREGWWGSYDTMSCKLDSLLHGHLFGYYDSGLKTGDSHKAENVGRALLASWRRFYSAGGVNIGNPVGYCLFDVNGMGDPLVSLTPQYERDWAGASGGTQVWDAATPNWRAHDPDLYVWEGHALPERTGLDHSTRLGVEVTESTVFNIAIHTATPTATFTQPADSTITLAGDGRFRAFKETVVNGGNLIWNVAGGCGYEGLKFVGAPGVLRLEGDKTRYFGYGFSNVQRVEWPGSNVTFDFGDSKSWNMVDKQLTVSGRNNRIRSYAPVFASDYKVNIEDGGELILETWNCAGTGNYDHDNILFSVRNGSTLAVDNNPRLQTENLSRSILLENGSALNLRTARFAFGNTAKNGMRVFARGTGNRIYGTGPVNINQCVWLDAAEGAELSVETGLAGGNAYLIGPGTIKMSGTSTTTGTLRLTGGANVIALTATALGKGSVVVEDGCTLDLRAIPLTGLKKLVVMAGGRLILPNTGTDGFYQVLEEDGTSLQLEAGALVCAAEAPETALTGTATSKGGFLVADRLLMWRGDAEGCGSWSLADDNAPFVRGDTPAPFANDSMVIFGELDDIESATVAVTEDVRPSFLDFVAYDTHYTFVGDGTLDYDNITLSGNLDFQNRINSPTRITVAGGKVTLKDFTTENLIVESGAEFRLTGTFALRTVAAKQIRFEFLTQYNAALPALQGISFYYSGGAKAPYPNPTTVRDHSGASATRTGGGSGAVLIDGGVGGIRTIIDGIYQGNGGVTHQSMPFLGIDAYTIGSDPKSYNRTATRWMSPNVSSGKPYLDITFGNEIGTSFGYKFHSGHAAGNNPKTWNVYLRENSSDPWVFYNERTQTVSGTYTAYNLETINFGAPHRTYTTVKSGATLVLDGTYQNTLTVQSGVTLKALPGCTLRLEGEYATLALGSGTYTIDASEADGIAQWQKLLSGANLTEASLSRFVCERRGTLLKIDNDGDLCIVTEGVITPPIARTLRGASETWNGAVGDWTWTAEVADGASEERAFNKTWNDTVIDTKGDLVITVARGVDEVTLDATDSDVRISRIVVRQEDPEARPALRLVANGNRVFSVDELDLTAFTGTFTLDAPITRTARTTVRMGGGVCHFPHPVTGSLAVEGADGEAHVNDFTEGLAANAGRVFLDEGVATPVLNFDFDAWPGDVTIAKPIAAVSNAGMAGALNLKDGRTLKVADGADLNVAKHLWTATTPLNDLIDQTGGTITCTGANAEKPYLLGVTRMTTRHRLSGDAVLNVTTGAADVGDRDEANGYGELELRDNARAYFAALCLSKGWIDIHPGAAIYIGGPNTSSAGSSEHHAGLMTVAGTLGAWQNSPHINIPFIIDFPDEKEIQGNDEGAAEGENANDENENDGENTPSEEQPAPPLYSGLPVAKIDANGHSLTLAAAITGRGALMVTNSLDGSVCTVTLSAANAYAGGTIVAAGQILTPASADALGTGGVRLARGAMLNLGTAVRGAPTLFTADAEGIVIVSLTLEEAQTETPLATVAEGVTAVPENLMFELTIDGNAVEGRPVKLVDGMICFDPGTAVVAPLYGTVTAAAQNWSAIAWTDALGRAVASPDWSAVDSIVVSNLTAGAVLTMDHDSETVFQSIRFEGPEAVTVAGAPIRAAQLDFSASPGSRVTSALTAGTTVICGATLTIDQPGAGEIVIPENCRAIVKDEPWGATVRNAGVIEMAFPVPSLRNPPSVGVVNAFTGGTAGENPTYIQTDQQRWIELERGDYRFIELRCNVATVTVHDGATVHLNGGGYFAAADNPLALAGGALVADDRSVTLNNDLLIREGGFIGAKPGCTLYVNGTISGSGTLTVGSDELTGEVVFRAAPTVPVRVAGGRMEPAASFTTNLRVGTAATLVLTDANDSGYIHITDGALTIDNGAQFVVNGETVGDEWRPSGGALRKGDWVSREGDGLWREAKWLNKNKELVAFPDKPNISAELLEANVRRIELHLTHTLYTLYVGGEVTLALCDGGRLTLEGVRGLDIDGHLTLDLSQRTEPGTIISGALDPTEVTIVGLPTNLHADIDTTGIRLLNAADYPARPAFWFYGSFGPGALVSRGQTLQLNDSVVSDDKRSVTVANQGLFVNNVGDWPGITLLSTTAGAMGAGAGERSIFAFSTWQHNNGTVNFWSDVIGLRLRQSNYNYWLTWNHDAWSSGNTMVNHLTDDDPHTFALSYVYENGTTPYCDGAPIRGTFSGLKGTGMLVTNITFGAQQLSGSTIPHTGARISSVMAFAERLSDAAVELWSRPRDLVVSADDAPPSVGFGRLLAVDGAAHTIASPVEAFALRTVAADARLAFADGGRLRAGLGGADLASVSTLDISALSFWDANEITLIEGDYYLPATVTVVTGGNPRTVVREANAVKVVNGAAYYGTLDAAADWTTQTGIAHLNDYAEGMNVNLRAAGAAATLTFDAATALGTVRLTGSGAINLSSTPRLVGSSSPVTIAELDLTDFIGTFALDGVTVNLIRTAAGGSTLDLGGREFVFDGSLAGGGLRVVGGGQFVVRSDAEGVLGAPVTVDDATDFVIDVSAEEGPVAWDWSYPETRIVVRTGARTVGFQETATLLSWGRLPPAEIVLENDNGGRFAVTKLPGGLQLAATIGQRVTLVRDGAAGDEVELSLATRWQSAGVVYDWSDLLDHGYTGDYALTGAVTAKLTAAGALRLSETRVIADAWRVVNDADAPLALAYDGAGVATNTVNLSSASVLSVNENVTVRRMQIGNARMRGTGTVINDGALPAGTNGYDDAEHWHGTVLIMNIATDSNAQIFNALYANATSAIEYNNAGGWGTVDTTSAATRFAFPCREVRVGAGGLNLYSGTSSATANAFYHAWGGELTGDGLVTIVNGAYNFREVFEGGGANFNGSITVPAAQGANMHIAFGGAPASWTSSSISIAAGATARLAAGQTWTTAYSGRGTRVAGTLIANGTLAGTLAFADGATLDLSERGADNLFTLPTVPTLPTEQPLTLRVAASAFADGRMKVVGWPTAAVPDGAVQLEVVGDLAEDVVPRVSVEGDGIYLDSIDAFTGEVYVDDATRTATKQAFAAPACVIRLVEPSLRTVENAACDITLDLATLADEVLASGAYAIAFSDLVRVKEIVQKDGWWATLGASGLTFAQTLTLTDAAEQTIDNTGRDVRLDLLGLPESAYTAGRAPIVFSEPSRVTVSAHRPGWWVEVTATGITFTSTAGLSMPTAWWVGDFSGNNTKGAMTLDSGDSVRVNDDCALKVKSTGIKVDGVPDYTRVSIVATAANIAEPGAADQSILVFGALKDSTDNIDMIGLRLRAASASPNLWFTWCSDAWSNAAGNTNTRRPADLAAAHTYGVGFNGVSGSGNRGSFAFVDGNQIAYASGLVSSDAKTKRATFGAQRVSNKIIPAVGAEYASMMIFDKVINGDLEKRVWTTTHPTVTAQRDAVPGAVLALKGTANKIAGRVQAFAVKAPVAASTLEFVEGAHLVCGPGGFRNEDAPVTISYLAEVGNLVGSTVTLVEGKVIAPENVRADTLARGCELVVDETGIKVVRTAVANDEAPELVAANPVTGEEQTFAFAFLGSLDLGWKKENFFTVDGEQHWTPATVTPHQPGDGDLPWLPTLVDGNLIRDWSPAREKVDGRYQIATTLIEGWNTKIALCNNVQLTVANLNKLQTGEAGEAWFMVDETSRLIFTGAGEKTEGLTKWFVAAPDGVEFAMDSYHTQNVAPGTFDYYFKGQGSVRYRRLSGDTTHRIAAATLEIGAGDLKGVVSKTLVAFTGDAVPQFALNTAAVTVADRDDVTATRVDRLPTAADAVGTYNLRQTDSGVVLTYVAFIGTRPRLFYREGYLDTTRIGASTDPLRIVNSDGVELTNAAELSNGILIFGERTTVGQAWASANTPCADIEIARDITFHSGDTGGQPIFDGVMFTVADGKRLTINASGHAVVLGAVGFTGAGAVTLGTGSAAAITGDATITIPANATVAVSGAVANPVALALGATLKTGAAKAADGFTLPDGCAIDETVADGVWTYRCVERRGTVVFTDGNGKEHWFERVEDAVASPDYDSSWTVTVTESHAGGIVLAPGSAVKLALPNEAALARVRVVFNEGPDLVAAGYVSLAIEGGHVVMAATEKARPVIDTEAETPFDLDTGALAVKTVPGLFYWVEHADNLQFTNASETAPADRAQATGTTLSLPLPKPAGVPSQFYRIKADAKR